MRLAILGTRGIPAQHGGFETFAERLALYLVSRGWDVTVYCPEPGGKAVRESRWNGIRLLYLNVPCDNACGTILFDWKSSLRSLREERTVLNLGYGTALFGFLYRFSTTVNIVNMDGMEWHRMKWSPAQRVWLYLNERLACLFAHHMIADHPEIEKHLTNRITMHKITMIPYGADLVTNADSAQLLRYDVDPYRYVLLVARPDPDNSIIEIVRAFSARRRGYRLVVLGTYRPLMVEYHRKVMESAGEEVLFLGGVYDKLTVEALRFFTRLYIHGHRVGGTNPSLVEAMASGSPVLAHDNRFNRWVAGSGAHYFQNERECEEQLDRLLDNDEALQSMRENSLQQYRERFTWDRILGDYESMLTKWQRPQVA